MEPAISKGELEAEIADYVAEAPGTTNHAWKFHAVQERHKALVSALGDPSITDQVVGGTEGLSSTVESEVPTKILLESVEPSRCQQDVSMSKTRGAAKKGRRRRRN